MQFEEEQNIPYLTKKKKETIKIKYLKKKKSCFATSLLINSSMSVSTTRSSSSTPNNTLYIIYNLPTN